MRSGFFKAAAFSVLAHAAQAQPLPCPDVDVTKLFILPDTSTVQQKASGSIVVGELEPAISIHRTLTWKNSTLCDERAGLGDFKVAPVRACYDIRTGVRTAGDTDTLIITDKNGHKFRFPELKPDQAIEIAQAYYTACRLHGNFGGLARKTLG